jgi:hypothetical protein
VAAASATDAWAIGLVGGGPGAGTGPSDKTLIEHWNGTAWTTVPSPTPSPAGALERVAVVSPTNAWAVGWTGNGTSDFNALIDHWDGKSWNVVPVPPSVDADIGLNAVAATSASNAWAVGGTMTSPRHGVILHWNGHQLAKAAAHFPTGNLLGVSASSPSNAWAVGQTTDSSRGCGPQCKTIIEHWNGTSWS